MANNPELLKMPLARDGQKSTIPETTDASTGLFSQQYGWQSINSLPPQAGGKAVKREDFNGAFNLLGGVAFMAQKGFTFKWSAEQDYYAGCVVIDDTDGLRYECIADVTANNTAPSADATHWQIFSAGTDLDAWFRQASTAYAVGDMRCYESLPYGWYLECTAKGITGSDALIIPSPLNVGDTVTDGAVVWTIRKMGDVDISGKADITGANMVYHKDVITTSGTYTAPATGLYKITVKGGGGGGGIPDVSSYSGGGGGEGGTTITYANLTAGNSIIVAVGAGGTGAGTPSDGGDSTVTINGTTYTAGGGKKGSGGCYGGEGGTGTIPGAPGGTGNRVYASAADITTGGSGGGAGGGVSGFATAPTSGVLGGGGAGLGRGVVGTSSAAGGDGYVWFEYYTP